MLNEQQFDTQTCPVEMQYATTFVECMRTGDMGPLYEVPLSYRTPKTVGGNKTKAQGRTLLARFAISQGVKHQSLDKYLDGGSGFGPTEDGNLKEIAGLLGNTIKARDAPSSLDKFVVAIASSLWKFGNPPTVNTETPPPAPTESLMTLDFTAPTPDEDLSSMVPASQAVATEPVAPVAGVILDSWADFEAVVPTLNATKADGDALIRAFFFTNQSSNGTVARVERSKLQWYDMKRMNTQLAWENPIQNASLHLVADALRISPKRNSNGKNRGFFFQLTDTSDDDKNGNRLWVCQLIAAHLIRESGRIHYNTRLAPLVSQRFVDEATAKLGISTAKRDSPVIGGSAKSWNWKYESSNWKTGGITVADITADTFSLANL